MARKRLSHPTSYHILCTCVKEPIPSLSGSWHQQGALFLSLLGDCWLFSPFIPSLNIIHSCGFNHHSYANDFQICFTELAPAQLRANHLPDKCALIYTNPLKYVPKAMWKSLDAAYALGCLGVLKKIQEETQGNSLSPLDMFSQAPGQSMIA